MKTLITLAALLGGALTAASGIGHVALAQPAPRTVAVHYGDLDLGSTAGREALGHRIRHAVRTACGDPSPADLKGQNLAAACREDLTDSLAQQREAAFAAASRRGPATLIARR